MSSKPKKLVIILPAYNEAENIAAVIEAIRALEFPDSISYFLLAVDDGSNDETYAQAIDADKIIQHPQNLGLGAAVRSGLNFARDIEADFVVKFDADLQHEPAEMLSMLELLEQNQADVVYGNRFGNIKYHMPFVRWLGNKIFTALMSWLTHWDIKDSQPGFFAVNKNYLNSFRIPGDFNCTQQILLDAFHRRLRFTQVPISFHERQRGKSFIDCGYPFWVLMQILRILISVNPLKVFLPISLFFIAISFLTAGYDLFQWYTGLNIRPIEHSNLVMGTFFFAVQSLFFGLIADLIIEKSARN